MSENHHGFWSPLCSSAPGQWIIQSSSGLTSFPVLSGTRSQAPRWEEARGYSLSFLINTPTADKCAGRAFPKSGVLGTGLQKQLHPEPPEPQAEPSSLPRLQLCTFVFKPHHPWQGAARQPNVEPCTGWVEHPPGLPAERRCKWRGDCWRNRDRQMLLHFKGNRALGGFQEYAQIDRLLLNPKHICSSVRQLVPEDGGRTGPLTDIPAG